jgi:tetraacyldisaccharide-1-P 4'-kinase
LGGLLRCSNLDHHQYSAQDWQRINRSPQRGDLIVTTEKDILEHSLSVDREIVGPAVAMGVENRTLIKAIVDRIHEIQNN